MADERLVIPENGIGIQSADLDLMAANAALAGDRVFAELLKLVPYIGSANKAILPYGQQLPGGTVGINVAVGPATGSALVVKSGAADAKLRIRPFRAIVGTRDTIDEIGHLDNWTDIRSALHIPSVADEWYSELQLAATAANDRWDLVHCRVDVDIPGATVQRFVKTEDGVVAPENLAPTKVCTVTLGVTQGVESATPTPPSLPSDSGTSYYIPLAKVYLEHPHTLVTAIDGRRIWEMAPMITLNSASVRPASMAAQVAGYANDTNNSGVRTRRYHPSTMVGLTSRFFQLGQLPVGTHTLDNSIDWRRRFFRWTAYASGSDNYGGPSPFINASGADRDYGGATSIHPSTPPTIAKFDKGDASGDNAHILTATTTAVCEIYVDFTSGNLMCEVTGETLQANLFVWLDATGQFDMQQTSPAYG